MSFNRLPSALVVGVFLSLTLVASIHIAFGIPAALSETVGLLILGVAAVTIGRALRRAPRVAVAPAPRGSGLQDRP